MKRTEILSLMIGAVLLTDVVSCRTTKFEISEGMTKAEYFQRAQEAAELSDWETAKAYYRMYIERYPEDTASIFAAEYEIAFITYKQGDLAEAGRLFSELIEKHERNTDPTVPQWPRVLSEKLLAEIERPGTEGA
jgi:outer membrane protein assembly factor BamD (BamD/ComL family)